MPTPNTSSETNIQADHPKIDVSTPAPPSKDRPPHDHYKITFETEKDWWDKKKPLAEIIGVILLGIYTCYTIKMYRANKIAADAAHSAADTASRQLQSFQDSESAQLVAEDFNPTIVRDPHSSDSMIIQGAINITNEGPTVAREIFQHGGYSSWQQSTLPNQAEQTLMPTPIPNGPSLAAGKSFPIFVNESENTWTDVTAGKWFFGYIVAISYRDIFKRPQIERECFTYSAIAKRFLRGCQVVVNNYVVKSP